MSVDFVNIFVLPPGELLYFVAVIAINQAGMFIALGQRMRRPYDRAFGRYTLATLGTLLAWVLLMIGGLYTLFTNQAPAAVIPPLERAVNVLSILIIAWAFLTADHDYGGRLPNVILIIFMMIVTVGYIITGLDWPGIAGQIDFNLSIYGVAWTFVPAILSIISIVLIAANFRIITDAPLKLVFFAVLFLGYGATLLQISQGNIIGDYAGASRLGFLAAMPILPAIIYRLVINQLENEVFTQSSQNYPVQTAASAFPAVTERSAPPSSHPASDNILSASSAPMMSPMQRDSVQLLKTLGLILEEATPANIPQRIITAALEVLKADIGAILTLKDANYADVFAAYDNFLQKPIHGLALNLNDQPTLVNSIERRLQRPLYLDRNIDELKDIYTRLDVEQTGPTYFQPLISSKEIVGVLMIGNPYSGHELNETERELLKGIAIIASNLLGLSLAAKDARLKAEERAIQAMVQGVPIDEMKDDAVLAARQEMQASLQLARNQANELSKQVMQLKVELEQERNRVATVIGDTEEGLSVSQRIIALNDQQQNLRDENEHLSNRLKEAEAALIGATANRSDDSTLRANIEEMRREAQSLQREREWLLSQLEELRKSGVQQPPVPQVVQDMLERMTQEKSRMEIERDKLSSKLTDLEEQMRAVGIQDGPAGVANLIQQLTEQRMSLQARNDALLLERNALLNERTQFETQINQEKERDTRFEQLQNEIKHLAEDREAAIRQNDLLRAERDELAAKANAIKEQRARLLAESDSYQMELAEIREEHTQFQARLEQLMDERSRLAAAHELLLAEKQALETERNLLLASSEGNRQRMQEVGEAGVGSLTRMIDELSQQRSQLEQELASASRGLEVARREINRLQNRDNGSVQPVSNKEYNELILSMVQEFRNPLTSLVGYTDLLLEESTAGILGEMQRKFLQRVAANINRMTFMLDEMTRVVALDSDSLALKPNPIDVVGIIEDVITNSANQFREKGLTVHLNLQDNLPKLQADLDAVNQIIAQLMTNAYLASPPNSQVFVTAHRQDVKLSGHNNFSTPTDSLLVSVEDRGGGIAQEDLPRVFARKYKAEHPLIQGIGDTGVGLSIAKALVEALGGALWLETRPNVGSIFYFALPINNQIQTEG